MSTGTAGSRSRSPVAPAPDVPAVPAQGDVPAAEAAARTAASTPTPRAARRVHGRRAAPRRGSTLTGTGTLLRFALRRDRIRLPVWVAAAAALVAVQSRQSQDLYSGPGDLDAYAASVGSNPAIIAMTGPPVGLDSLGGAVAFEIGTTVAVVVGLMALFTVVRHTRGDEEAGRTELVRATRVGRHAPVAAATSAAGLAGLGVAVSVAVVATATGLPLTGGIVFGASLGVLAVVFAAVAAVTSQVAEHPRAALGIGGATLGAAIALRAVGDVGDGRLSWLSPVGWTQAAHAWSGNRWWPLLLGLGAAVLLVAGALLLVDRRDLGAGIVPTRPGRETAGRFLSGPLGLAWRLQRAALLGWAAGIALAGLMFGAVVDATLQLADSNPELVALLPGGAGDLVDAFLAVILAMCALLVVAAGVATVLRSLGEESSGRAELVLGTATDRIRWLGSHVLVALVGTAVLLVLAGASIGAGYGLDTGRVSVVPEVTRDALVLLPAVWLLVAVAVALVGLAPRRAAAASWALVAYAAVVAMLADSLRWPEWVGTLSPVAQTPAVPLEDVTVAPLAVLAALAALGVAVGLTGFRRRDVG